MIVRLLALTLSTACAIHIYNLPSVDNIKTAGFVHGQRAKKQIAAFLQTREVVRLVNFTKTLNGSAALQTLRRSSPSLEDELAGIAAGSGADVDAIWAVNLLSELEALMASSTRTTSDGHCSDILARASDGSIYHGHNEDWSRDFSPLLYLIVYNSANRSAFQPIAGLVYPGQAVGFAVAFTEHVWATSNSLFPMGLNQSGEW